MIDALKSILKSEGAPGLARIVSERILARKIAAFEVCRPFLEGFVGLEIGGPSSIFRRRHIFPVYPVAAHIDNCNFSDKTMWEGAIKRGNTFNYDRHRVPGRQFIAEATDLSAIASESYDFILSSHVLEHVANPIRALAEWIRVLKVGGVMILVVPHKQGTFDHRRPITTLEHLVSDFEQGTLENDMTHAPEILNLHDLARDPGAGDFVTFKARTQGNVHNRGLHHHVFDTSLAARVVDYVHLQLLAVEAAKPYHIFAAAQKLNTGLSSNNDLFLGERARYHSTSPFQSDWIC
jgi:SAM-dependent methyltransferase